MKKKTQKMVLKTSGFTIRMNEIRERGGDEKSQSAAKIRFYEVKRG